MGFAEFIPERQLNTESSFKSSKAEDGFLLLSSVSSLHKVQEVVGEHCASQPGNATEPCNVVTFLAFGNFFCPLLAYPDCLRLLSSKEGGGGEKESRFGTSRIYFLRALVIAFTFCSEDVWVESHYFSFLLAWRP